MSNKPEVMTPEEQEKAKIEASKQAFENWDKWRRDHIERAEIETFVPIYNGYVDYRRYVSNFGNVVFFVNPDEPKFYSQKKDFSIDDKGYWRVPIKGSPLLSVIVWWSHEYDSIVNNKPKRNKGIHFHTVDEFTEAFIHKKGLYEVHHDDEELGKDNNTLDKLYLLKAEPKEETGESMHDDVHIAKAISKAVRRGETSATWKGKTYRQVTDEELNSGQE